MTAHEAMETLHQVEAEIDVVRSNLSSVIHRVIPAYTRHAACNGPSNRKAAEGLRHLLPHLKTMERVCRKIAERIEEYLSEVDTDEFVPPCQ